MNLQDNVANLKGVGKKRLPLLAKLRIETMDDLVHFFPRRYEDRRQIVPIMAAPIGRDVLIGGNPVGCHESGVVARAVIFTAGVAKAADAEGRGTAWRSSGAAGKDTVKNRHVSVRSVSLSEWG